MSFVSHFLTSVSDAFSHFVVWAFLPAIVAHVARPAVRARAWQNLLAAAFPDATVRWRDAFGVYPVKNGVGEFLPMRDKHELSSDQHTPPPQRRTPSWQPAGSSTESRARMPSSSTRGSAERRAL